MHCTAYFMKTPLPERREVRVTFGREFQSKCVERKTSQDVYVSRNVADLPLSLRSFSPHLRLLLLLQEFLRRSLPLVDGTEFLILLSIIKASFKDLAKPL